MQDAYLDQVIAYAMQIREKLEDLALSQDGRVHFRPTSHGITIVGLLPQRPQRGKGGHSADKLVRDFEAEFRKHCEAIPQGRLTPEKRIQSFLIGNAYKHQRRFQVLPLAERCSSVYFITDELPAFSEEGKIVCDILALYQTPDEMLPVVMELKTKRQMAKLVEQLERYAAIIKQQHKQFERLFSAVLGEQIRFSGPSERWLVWPAAGSGADRREAELARQGIRVVQYSPDGGGYSFHVGTRPSLGVSQPYPARPGSC